MNAAARRRALLIPLAGAALVLSACAATSSETEETPTANPAAASADDTGDTTATDDGLTSTACLTGSWHVDPVADAQRLEDYLGAFATDITVTTGGDGTMTLTGDTLTTAYEDQAITQEFAVGGHRIVVAETLNGTISDPYTVTENTIELTGHEPDPELDVQFSTTVDGVESVLPGDASFVPGGLVRLSGLWGFQCTGDELIFYWLDGPKTVDDAIQVYARR
jgi:hypothetical protein